jgi:hypothetical protein
MAELKSKAVTVADLKEIDLDGPPKLYMLSLPENATQQQIQDTVAMLRSLNLHESNHKFLLIRGELRAENLTDEALRNYGLLRRLNPHTPTANARPA